MIVHNEHCFTSPLNVNTGRKSALPLQTQSLYYFASHQLQPIFILSCCCHSHLIKNCVCQNCVPSYLKAERINNKQVWNVSMLFLSCFKCIMFLMHHVVRPNGAKQLVFKDDMPIKVANVSYQLKIVYGNGRLHWASNCSALCMGSKGSLRFVRRTAFQYSTHYTMWAHVRPQRSEFKPHIANFG